MNTRRCLICTELLRFPCTYTLTNGKSLLSKIWQNTWENRVLFLKTGSCAKCFSLLITTFMARLVRNCKFCVRNSTKEHPQLQTKNSAIYKSLSSSFVDYFLKNESKANIVVITKILTKWKCLELQKCLSHMYYILFLKLKCWLKFRSFPN